MSDNKDIKYIRRCFELAEKGSPWTHPNPLVGSVIVYNDSIIGEGYHTGYGKPHAEVEAIASVQDKTLLQKSVLYVNLEPCSHFGKTPPCSDLILAHNIPRVVLANGDPHTEVNGKGIQKLRDAGVEVVTDILEADGRILNRSFFTFHEKCRPHIVLKWAETQDGFIGRLQDQQDKNKRISNTLSDRYTHQLRAESGAILVGTNTAILDNPSLNTRLRPGRNPLRVVIDIEGKIPESHTLFTDEGQTLVFGKTRPNSNTQFIPVDETHNVIETILNELSKRSITQLMVEGGKNVLDQFISNNLWDEIHQIIGNDSWGSGVQAPNLELAANETISLDDDQINVYYSR